MKPKNIKPETISKVSSYLNHLSVYLSAHGGRMSTKERVVITDQYKQSYGLFASAIKAGYFAKNNDGTFKALINKFEPINSRRVLEVHYENHNERQKAKAKIASDSRVKRKYTRRKLVDPIEVPVDMKKHVAPKAIISTDHSPRLVKKDFNNNALSPESTMTPALQKEVRKYNKKRVFSIFWGLIKFNY